MKRDNRNGSRKDGRKNWWPVGAALLGAALLLAAGGCQSEQLNQMLNVPTPPPTPTPAPQPKPDFFDPADYTGFLDATGAAPMPGVKLPPGQHRVAGVTSAELLTVQSVSVDKKGRPVFGATAEAVHLAGIIAPAPGKPGWQKSVQAVQNWTVLHPKSKTVEVEVDPRFPYDLAGRHMVQIFFTGRPGPHEGKKLSLNRMLVRSGWAVVDLHSATAIDLQAWLNDERYARTKRLGLWGMGIALQQRDPVPLPKNARREKGRSNIRIESARPGAAGAGAAGRRSKSSGPTAEESSRMLRTGESMTYCKDGTKSFAKDLDGHHDNCASHGGVLQLNE